MASIDGTPVFQIWQSPKSEISSTALFIVCFDSLDRKE